MLESCARILKGRCTFTRIFSVTLLCFSTIYIPLFLSNKTVWHIGLSINEARPHDKLPYRGAWLWVGTEMIHLMELPNPDPLTGRPEHGGRDRHACLAIRDVSKLKDILDKAGNPSVYTVTTFVLLIMTSDLYVVKSSKAGIPRGIMNLTWNQTFT